MPVDPFSELFNFYSPRHLQFQNSLSVSISTSGTATDCYSERARESGKGTDGEVEEYWSVLKNPYEKTILLL